MFEIVERTEIVEVTRRPTHGEGAANADPERGESKSHSRPPKSDKILRYLKKESIEDQKGGFDRPKDHENQQSYYHSQLQVIMVEWIRQRWSFLLLCAYPCDSSRIWEAGCVCAGECCEENDGEQM